MARACLMFACWATLSLAQAQVRIESLSLSPGESGLQLSGQLHFELPNQVAEALQRGVPLFFTAEAALYQERWYWADKLVAQSQRYWKLSYLPLTRRYRLQVGQQPIENTGLGAGLAQTFEALPEAMFALQRLSAWTLPATSLESQAAHRLEFRFRLDPNPMMRPWLVGLGESEWALSVQRNLSYRPGAAP